jgi:hypothetical protein
VNLADFLTPIISWVEDGVAPGEVEADTFSLTLRTITFQQTVQPYDALAPVHPAPGGLNGHYDYIGSYSLPPPAELARGRVASHVVSSSPQRRHWAGLDSFPDLCGGVRAAALPSLPIDAWGP